MASHRVCNPPKQNANRANPVNRVLSVTAPFGRVRRVLQEALDNFFMGPLRKDRMAKPKVFCVSGGGASAGAYLIWFKALPKDIDLELLDIPGRGLRKSEAPLTALEDIVDDFYSIVKQKVEKDSPPYFFVGYCFGATIVYELCRKIKKEGLSLPKRVFFASSDPTPELSVPLFDNPSCEEPLRELAVRYFPESIFPDREKTGKIARRFVGQMAKNHRRYNRLVPVTMEELFPNLPPDDPAYAERACAVDFANDTLVLLYEDYRMGGQWQKRKDRLEPVSVDMTIFAGKDDAIVPVEKASLWKQWALADCDIQIIDGSHAFVFEEPGYRQCVEALARAVRSYEKDPVK